MHELPYTRWCFAATHVAVRDSYRDVPHRHDNPAPAEALAEHIDWDTTMAFRQRLDGLGFGIAEAMDTAQRFAIGWPIAERLIEETGRLRLANGFIAGAGQDALPIERDDDLVASVVSEAETIERAGGYVIVLPLPHLSATGAGEDRFVSVYKRIIDRLRGPIFLHWLGEAFMPALRGYFPGDTFFEIMAHDPKKVKGAKLSLLDAAFERDARARLLNDGQFILTGDDFKFGELIRGEDQEILDTIDVGQHRVPIGAFSHALLGIFDAIAGPMARALAALRDGDLQKYDAIAGPCEALGRWIFQPPTQYYKSGLAYLAWANGLQGNDMLLNHEELARDKEYYDGILSLAQAAGAIDSPHALRSPDS